MKKFFKSRIVRTIALITALLCALAYSRAKHNCELLIPHANQSLHQALSGCNRIEIWKIEGERGEWPLVKKSDLGASEARTLCQHIEIESPVSCYCGVFMSYQLRFGTDMVWQYHIRCFHDSTLLSTVYYDSYDGMISCDAVEIVPNIQKVNSGFLTLTSAAKDYMNQIRP